MKHFDVALAFIKGEPAKNARLKTDGLSLYADGRVIATKTDEGLVLVGTHRSRSGSIMRSAVKKAAYRARTYANVTAKNGLFPVTRGELIKLWQEDCDERASIGMSPLIFNGTGQP